MEVILRDEEITQVAVDELVPNPRNPNKHSAAQIERLAAIIRYQGFRNPVIVSKQSGFIVAGHGRIQAAKKLGMKTVSVTYQNFDDETQEYAAMVSDNSIAEWSTLDLSLINKELPELGPLDITLLGLQSFYVDPAELPEEEKEKSKAGRECPECGFEF
jgi:ParB/RepB/Spo0J family partition protein